MAILITSALDLYPCKQRTNRTAGRHGSIPPNRTFDYAWSSMRKGARSEVRETVVPIHSGARPVCGTLVGLARASRAGADDGLQAIGDL